MTAELSTGMPSYTAINSQYEPCAFAAIDVKIVSIFSTLALIVATREAIEQLRAGATVH